MIFQNHGNLKIVLRISKLIYFSISPTAFYSNYLVLSFIYHFIKIRSRLKHVHRSSVTERQLKARHEMFQILSCGNIGILIQIPNLSFLDSSSSPQDLDYCRARVKGKTLAFVSTARIFKSYNLPFSTLISNFLIITAR